jgi:N-acetylmuramoyl-L-alanine amidase
VGKIGGNNVNFRATASSSGALIGTLAQNTVVYIYSQSGDFYKLSANGVMGYVSKQFVTDQAPLTTGSTTAARKLGTITATSIKLYTKATSASTVIVNIKKYNIVEILSSTSSYYKIKTTDGKVGYALKKYISLLKAPGTTTAAVNVRKTANASASVLKKLALGDVVEILATQGEWYKISAAGVTGYIMSSYIAPLNP